MRAEFRNGLVRRYDELFQTSLDKMTASAKTRNNMNTTRLLTAIALTTALASHAWAQSPAAGYPSKPIKLISPYPPGGGTDAAARIIAQALGDQMGQQVEIGRAHV